MWIYEIYHVSTITCGFTFRYPWIPANGGLPITHRFLTCGSRWSMGKDLYRSGYEFWCRKYLWVGSTGAPVSSLNISLHAAELFCMQVTTDKFFWCTTCMQPVCTGDHRWHTDFPVPHKKGKVWCEWNGISLDDELGFLELNGGTGVSFVDAHDFDVSYTVAE